MPFMPPPIRRSLFALAPALLIAPVLGGCYGYAEGPSASSRADRVPAARVVGTPEACIPLTAFNETRVRDGRTIDFMAPTGRRGWRNTLPYDCPGLASEQAFSFNTSLTQLCSTDIIRVLDRTGGDIRPGASCGLGQFTPIELRGR